MDITKCGIETRIMNKYTTDEVNKRKLQLSYDKCAKMHLTPKKRTDGSTKKCENVTMDLWTVEKDAS